MYANSSKMRSEQFELLKTNYHISPVSACQRKDSLYQQKAAFLHFACQRRWEGEGGRVMGWGGGWG